MRSIFDWLTRMALQFRPLTILVVIVIMAIGGVSATQLNQELLPPVEFPQTIILGQVSGMTSEQVLTVMTERLEEALLEIPEILNVESQTTASIGVIITASTEFGIDQDALRAEIRAKFDDVYLPTRRIAPDSNESTEVFVARLMGDLDAATLIYLAEQQANFLFQLSPEAWDTLSVETTEALLAYLAQQQAETEDSKTALEQLVEQEVIPRIEAVDVVARVQIDGGQPLPGEDAAIAAEAIEEEIDDNSLLLQLSPAVWNVVRAKIDDLGAQNQTAVERFAEQAVTIPEEPPTLPESWQFDAFNDASDLQEMVSFTRTLPNIFNDFVTDGEIEGALGQTDDLTVEIVERMLAIEPTLAQYFEAEQLTALTPEVYEALPQDQLTIDAFTRNELAATFLARDLTGNVAQPEPVDLPSAWQIQPPALLSFSFADIPLATFSVFSTITPDESSTETIEADETTDEDSAAADDASDAESARTDDAGETIPDYPQGPALPALYAFFGDQCGFELDTADDLLEARVPASFADPLLGGDTSPVAVYNVLPQLSAFAGDLLGGGGDAAAADSPAGADFEIPCGFDNFGFAQITQLAGPLAECDLSLPDVLNRGQLNVEPLINATITCPSAEVWRYIEETEPEFIDGLSTEVVNLFDAETYLAVESLSPILTGPWDTLGDRPEFDAMPLETGNDIVEFSNGSPSAFLNEINSVIGEEYDGFRIQLFDALTPNTIAYFVAVEEDFYANLEAGVVLSFSQDTLAAIPDGVIASFDEDVASEVTAIANGEREPAVTQVATGTSDRIEPREDAPPLNPQWDQIAGFLGVELENAFDLFRFPQQIGTPAGFINGLFNSPNGSSFAPGLLGNMPVDAFFYIADEDPDFINNLEPRALNLLNEDIYDQLPQSARDRAEAGEVFIPDTQVTRTNGAPSLLVTIYKDADANTVAAYAAVEEIINEIDANNDDIATQVAFEQSSFIEESITGVIREGSLGAFFAIVNILIFLSGDIWGQRGRIIVGIGVIIVFALVSLLLVVQAGSVEQAFDTDNALFLFSVLGIIGMFAGVGILLWPGRLPYPSWRSTLVIGVSIPLSILSALMLMRWLPVGVAAILEPFGDNSVTVFIQKLAPQGLTLNIMTLSGLTVAVGRLVDDSIVVLENIFRQMQSGMDKKEAVLSGVRDVSVAIFSATSIAVIVFLPLGLTGGLISEFFLPFGVAVTYTLLSSFVAAITVIPVLAYTFISPEHVPADEETWMQRAYVPTLERILGSPVGRWTVVLLAIISFGASIYLFGQRPAAFLPDFGEPEVSINVTLPEGTSIIETNEQVTRMEDFLLNEIDAEQITTVRTVVGGGGLGFETLLGGGGVSENAANITLSVATSRDIEMLEATVSERAIEIFGEENVEVSVGTLSSGGFGGFELLISGADQETLASYEDEVIEVLESLPELQNVTSNLASEEEENEDAPPTFVRVNGGPAITFTGEVLTEDTINFVNDAIMTLEEEIDFPEGVNIGQGFDSELQSEGFNSIFVAMSIALVFVVLILVLVFSSPIYWLAVIFSVVVAPFGAAVALTLTNRVLGISALIGLLMLLGLVVTNAVVLIDRVSSNRFERGMSLYDALVEAGSRRVRPILMTALTTIVGLLPLSLGLAEGAIIAAELGTVVIGGVISSTLLTLIVVPAAYYLLTPLNDGFLRLVGRDPASGVSDSNTGKTQ